MTKKYFQLTLEQRYRIEALKTEGFTQTAIAVHLGFSKSTISREFKRNIPKRGSGAKIYVAEKAHIKSVNRHRFKHKAICFDEPMKKQVRRWLKIEKLSPEFISAQWVKNGQPGVSHETIYKWIWKCKFSNQRKHVQDKYIYVNLKHARRRRKRGNSKDNRGLIQNRVSIENRPRVVE